jgi:hypothetical protein
LTVVAFGSFGTFAAFAGDAAAFFAATILVLCFC